MNDPTPAVADTSPLTEPPSRLPTEPPTTRPATGKTGRGAALTSRAGRGTGRIAAIFIGPFLVLFVAALIVPIGFSVYLSLFTEKRSGLGFGGKETLFVGLGNYSRVLGDPEFISGFGHLAVYCLLYIPIMMGLALFFALLLDTAVAKAKRAVQLLLFLPHAVPGLFAALIWTYLYTPSISPLVNALHDGGIAIDFFSVHMTMPSIVNISVWEWTGYNFIILFTALQAIDHQYLEAARIDGASGPRQAWSIKVPMIRPAIGITILFTTIGTLQLFTEPLIMRGATTTVTSTYVPNMWIYDAAFSRHDFGLAAAGSIVMAVVAGLLSWGVTKINGRLSK